MKTDLSKLQAFIEAIDGDSTNEEIIEALPMEAIRDAAQELQLLRSERLDLAAVAPTCASCSSILKPGERGMCDDCVSIAGREGVFYCTVCRVVPVLVEEGIDTCPGCLRG